MYYDNTIPPVLRQYLIVIVVNFINICFGMETGWPSPVIAKLREPDQKTLAHSLTNDDAAWIASIGIAVGMFAMFIIPYLMDHLGRKFCLILLCIPRMIKCLIMIFATDVWMLLLGRSLNGISDLFGISLLITYTSEIASKEIRGALGTISQISFAIGIMIMLTVGPFLSYLMLNIMHTVLVFALFVPLLFLPETPYFLYSKGREEELIKVLTLLRGTKEAAHEEIKDYSTTEKTAVNKLNLLRDVTVWKSLGKSIVLIVASQLTGYNSISFYLQSVFASTHTTLKPEVSSSVIGCIELLGCFCTIFMTDKFGRKPILTISLSFMAVGMMGMGTFFYLKTMEYKIVGFLNYLPLMSIMLVIFCYNAGLGSIMMMYIAELFDGSARAFGVSTAVFFSSLVMFFVIRFFSTVTSTIGPSCTYYGFGIFCIVTCIYIAFCLPETKGKAFSQIQAEMKHEKVKNLENDTSY